MTLNGQICLEDRGGISNHVITFYLVPPFALSIKSFKGAVEVSSPRFEIKGTKITSLPEIVSQPDSVSVMFWFPHLLKCWI